MEGSIVQLYQSLTPRDLVQIAILAVVIFGVLRFLAKTCGAGSFLGRGLGLVVVGFFLLVQVVLASLDWTELAPVLDYFLTAILLMLLIIFQPELRRGLMILGRSKLWRMFSAIGPSPLEVLATCTRELARDRTGALIAVQREISLAPYIEAGEAIDGQLSASLVHAIFYPGGPLHDGAIIVVGDRIAAAASQLPLADHERFLALPAAQPALQLGMRHRAAVGLSEETDAIVLVVSEETGRISIAVGGRLERVPAELVHERLQAVFDTRTSAPVRQAA